MGVVGQDRLFMMVDGLEKDVTPWLSKFVWIDSLIDGGFSWEIQLASEFWEEWYRFMLGQTVAMFRLVSYHGDIPTTTDWLLGIVDGSTSSYQGTRLVFIVWGADRRLELQQKTRTRAWPNASTSDVVRAIGSEYGVVVMAGDTEDRRDRWQIHRTDWDYLYNLANSTEFPDGRGDVFLWMHNNFLLLGTPTLQQQSARRYDLSMFEDRLIRMTSTYSGRKVDRLGGATLHGVGYNFQAKTAVEYSMDLPATVPYPALAKFVPRMQFSGFRYVPVAEFRPDLVKSKVSGEWGHIASRYFSMRVDVRGDVLAIPGSTMDVLIGRGEGMGSPVGGRYMVLEVQHVLTAPSLNKPNSGGLVTTLVGFRRESELGEEIPAGAFVAVTGSVDPYVTGAPEEAVVTKVVQSPA
jgi:hypothetical protein